MSTTLENSFAKQFQGEVHAAYQRTGSKLRNTVRTINDVNGASAVFQKVGKGLASTKASGGMVPVANKMFELNGTISKLSRVDEEDVKNTKSILRDFGLYPKDKPIEGFTDNEMFDGIKEFQKIAGVRVDGVMRPKGETELRVNQVIDGMRKPPKPSPKPEVKSKPPVPEKKPVRDCSALKTALDNARRDMNIKDATLRNANKELQALKQKRDALKVTIEKETGQRNKAVIEGVFKGGYRGGRMGAVAGPWGVAAGAVAGGTIGGTVGYGVEELVDVLSGDGTLGTVEEGYQKIVSKIGNLSVSISKLYVPELRIAQERVKKANEAYRACKNHNG